MANNVFANGREISCKAGAGKTICAFPDVCMTPPQTPATPPGIPIPYPNTGKASDTSNGSKKVKISGKTIGLKDKSFFRTSTGDEAGSAPLKNVVTGKITGKVYFASWSSDIKFEGENVVRHLDLTTHNHGSKPGGTGPMPTTDTATPEKTKTLDEKCAILRSEILNKYAKLGKELRKYDPVSDALGGFKKHGGLPGPTKPGGHYTKIRAFQRGLKNDLTRFSKECSASSVKIDKKVDRSANQEIQVPPGLSRIPL